MVHIFEIESIPFETILHEERIHIWVKSSVCTRDLEKRERRKSKGSVAQASSIKRKLTAAKDIKAEKSMKTENISKEEFIAELNKQEYLGLLTKTTYCELMEVLKRNI